MNSQPADTMQTVLDTEKVRRLRISSNLSMEQAALSAGLAGRQSWYEIESGRKSDVRVSTLEAIARALGCRAADLLK